MTPERTTELIDKVAQANGAVLNFNTDQADLLALCRIGALFIEDKEKIANRLLEELQYGDVTQFGGKVCVGRKEILEALTRLEAEASVTAPGSDEQNLDAGVPADVLNRIARAKERLAEAERDAARGRLAAVRREPRCMRCGAAVLTSMEGTCYHEETLALFGGGAALSARLAQVTAEDRQLMERMSL